MSSIAIIGSGPTAIYTARHLLADASARLEITMFEAQAEAGKGMPYHEKWNDKSMLANIASIEIPPVNETLVDWLTRQTDERLSEWNIERSAIDERSFYPRIVLGAYFQAQLQQLAEANGSSLKILTQSPVEDVMLRDNGIRIAYADPESNTRHARFSHAVIATGHSWPEVTETRPGYFLSPWPASALSTIGHVHVGIRGTSLSAIDAAVALATARGMFANDENGQMNYYPEPGTENFRMTMISRKGLLPEADFYHPIPYEPLSICTKEAIEALIEVKHPHLLDEAYRLFTQELAACAPEYAASIGLAALPLENFCHAYFHAREQEDPFQWAEKNLAEAIRNQSRGYTVAWRYAILRMHEVIALIAPHLNAEDHPRFNRHLKPVFVDDYATVPHASIERMLALHRANKLDILSVGENYTVDTDRPEGGAHVTHSGGSLTFPAFIEAMGQPVLGARDFPFPSLRQQGVVRNAMAPHRAGIAPAPIGGIALDETFHPISDIPYSDNLYCISVPFLLGQFPFAQGITSSHDMGKKVARDILETAAEPVIMPLGIFQQPKERRA